MKSLGQAGSAKPRVRPGDMERALALITELGGDKKSREYLADLVAAEAEADKARTVAEAAIVKAKQRESEAQAAEADAIRARQALADESAKARDELGKRETAVAERERVAGEVKHSQEARDKELQRREDHLRKAGVRGF